MVVIGDRDFASNRLLEALYNRDLFMNAVRWLANDEKRIALGDKALDPEPGPADPPADRRLLLLPGLRAARGAAPAGHLCVVAPARLI